MPIFSLNYQIFLWCKTEEACHYSKHKNKEACHLKLLLIQIFMSCLFQFVRELFPSLSNASRVGEVSPKNNDMLTVPQGTVFFLYNLLISKMVQEC